MCRELWDGEASAAYSSAKPWLNKGKTEQKLSKNFGSPPCVRRELWDGESSANESLYFENGVTVQQPVSLFTLGEHYLMTAADFAARSFEYNASGGECVCPHSLHTMGASISCSVCDGCWTVQPPVSLFPHLGGALPDVLLYTVLL